MARRRWGALLGALLLLGLALGHAGAHAELLEAYPAPGAIYRWERPAEVRLLFSQPLAAEGSRITLINRRFDAVPIGAATLDPADPNRLHVALPSLPQGTYTVNWQTTSVDGHPLQGSYPFTIYPREPLITTGIAALVLLAMGALVWSRRARPGDDLA